MVVCSKSRIWYFCSHIFQWYSQKNWLINIIKKIKNRQIDKSFIQRKQTTIDKQHFKPVIEGLAEVYNSGTARRLQIPDIAICGKTGTVENAASVDGESVKLKDHSVFLAYAPKENPKIVVAVFIENGGFGATWAGPIASLMIEKYLKGEITRTDLEKRMFEGNLIPNKAEEWEEVETS